MKSTVGCTSSVNQACVIAGLLSAIMGDKALFNFLVSLCYFKLLCTYTYVYMYIVFFIFLVHCVYECNLNFNIKSSYVCLCHKAISIWISLSFFLFEIHENICI